MAHDRITFNLHKALDARLADKLCKSFGPNVKIVTPRNDALVTCTPTNLNATVVDEPVVVFEVVSEDQATASIQRYVILEQKSIGAAVFARKGEDWIAAVLTEENTLAMPEIGIGVPIAEFHAGLEYSAPTEGEAAG
jgi:hypothetical protein